MVTTCAGLLLSVLLPSGCTQDEDPARPPTNGIEYEPADRAVQMPMDQYLDFRAIDSTTTQYDVTWERRGEAVSFGPRYRYFPHAYGADTLTARVDYPDQSLRHTWLIDITYPALAVEFTPEADSLNVIETMSVEFSAANNRSDHAHYEWTLQSQPAGTDSTFLFEASEIGWHIVRGRVSVGTESVIRAWHVQVLDIDDVELPPTRDLSVTRTLSFGEFSVFWRPITDWFLPISEYQVRYSYDGPITLQNVGITSLLKTLPGSTDQDFYNEVFVVGENAPLVEGAEVWFAIVAIDSLGNTSLSTDSPMLHIPFFWYLDGTIQDVYGTPLAEIEVWDSAGQHRVLSDAHGEYRIGPYASATLVALGTTGDAQDGQLGWLESVSPSISYFDRSTWNFILIPRYEIPSGCPEHRGNFANYLRYMTTTLQVRQDRPNLNLYHWENYPLKVYVPDHVAGTGIDFGAAARFAVQVWELLLGEPTLELVEDPGTAEITYEFEPPNASAYGVTQLVEPGGGDLHLGAVVPEKVTILLYENINTQFAAEVTALHEMGHALGLVTHSPCNNVGYLMYSAPSPFTEDWPDHAVHPNELQAVRLIRHLPQAFDMGVYPTD